MAGGLSNRGERFITLDAADDVAAYVAQLAGELCEEAFHSCVWGAESGLSMPVATTETDDTFIHYAALRPKTGLSSLCVRRARSS